MISQGLEIIPETGDEEHLFDEMLEYFRRGGQDITTCMRNLLMLAYYKPERDIISFRLDMKTDSTMIPFTVWRCSYQPIGSYIKASSDSNANRRACLLIQAIMEAFR